jgi:hypothetical protein
MTTDKPNDDNAPKAAVKKPSLLDAKLKKDAHWMTLGKADGRFTDRKSNAVKSKGIRRAGR